MKLEELLAEYAELPEFLGMRLDSVNVIGGFSSAPIHIAIYRDRIEEVQCLLDNGANPNVHGEVGELPLQVAVRKKRQDIVDLLIAHSADPGLSDSCGRSSYLIARKFGIVLPIRDGG